MAQKAFSRVIPDPETPLAGGDPAAPSGQAAGTQEIYAFPIPDDEQFTGKRGIELLMEACTLYNINPDKEAEPVQLLGWKFYEGDRRLRRPDRIVLVTAGGLKIAHPADEETVERLQRVFKRIRITKGKDGSETTEILPMPEDLSLPTAHVTGYAETDDHVYTRGYLREGGAVESNRREIRRRAAVDR